MNGGIFRVNALAQVLGLMLFSALKKSPLIISADGTKAGREADKRKDGDKCRTGEFW